MYLFHSREIARHWVAQKRKPLKTGYEIKVGKFPFSASGKQNFWN
jgi:hypothetical protein